MLVDSMESLMCPGAVGRKCSQLYFGHPRHRPLSGLQPLNFQVVYVRGQAQAAPVVLVRSDLLLDGLPTTTEPHLTTIYP